MKVSSQTFTNIQHKLTDINQSHVLKFYNELKPKQQKKLVSQLAALNLDEIKNLAETHVKVKPESVIPKNISAVDTYPHSPTPELVSLYTKAEARGKELVHKGHVGAFLVAGGQGTRLGFEGPKGMYPISTVKNKSLFQIFAEQLRSHAAHGGKPIPWYIMTSDANRDATESFFKKHSYFGYDPKDIFFFTQGLMPAFSMDGKLLLEDKDSLALSPDGHGGSLRALHVSGALADMKHRGVQYLSYFQVDNPLVHCIDYTFIGLHDLVKSEMSSKTIPKAGPLEKVGNFVKADGKTQVIEYSDMPEVLAKETLPDGSLRFNAGSIAIHILSVDFVERLHRDNILHLPWHRAEKKVAYINETGEKIKPETPNAVKLEQFVFDAIPLAKNALVYETTRAEEFSPVKNAEGVDSPHTSLSHQKKRAAAWLHHAGVNVPHHDGEPAATIEIEPLFAHSAPALKDKLFLLKIDIGEIKVGELIYFGAHGVERTFFDAKVSTSRLRKLIRALSFKKFSKPMS